MATLTIKNLHVEVEGKEILKGVNLTFNSNETVALLGPNGHGKSTLLMVIMGHPKYKITEGSISLDGEDVLKMSTDERSKKGLFLAMQYPSEIPGVITSDFLKTSINVRREKPIRLFEFYKLLEKTAKECHIPFDMTTRSLNEGFSGGEKKRNEMMQMLILNPLFSMLDEIDSGLDVDAIQVIANVIKKRQEEGKGFLIVSHYARLYDLIHTDRVVVIVNGKIEVQGGVELIKKIDQQGYEWLHSELGITIEKEMPINTTSIGVCATKEMLKNE